MSRRPPRFTCLDTLLPYTTRFRSREPCRMRFVLRPSAQQAHGRQGGLARARHGQDDVEAGLRHTGRADRARKIGRDKVRSEEHTSELQSLMRSSYAVFCVKKKITNTQIHYEHVL